MNRMAPRIVDPPMVFNVDHPFFYKIVDKNLVTLFEGDMKAF